MTPDELHYLDLGAVSERIRRGALSPVNLTEAMLARIGKLNPRLNAYERVTPELALRQAREAEGEIKRGHWRGPLHGVPMALKDNIATQEHPCGNGMIVPIPQLRGIDSAVASRLRRSGAVLLGKLRQTEGAFIEHHPSVAAPVNPWSAAAWCGVSSSGSGVATAAGLCFASLGTDTGGSIRMPCDMNGVTGMKPTYGRVSRYGVIDNSPSLDHVGPMARSVRDIATVMSTITGPDPNDPTSIDAKLDPTLTSSMTKGVRLGLDEQFAFGGIEEEVATALTGALEVLERCGAQIVPIRFPDPEAVVQAWVIQSSIEIAAVHRETFDRSAAEYGPALTAFIQLGRSMDFSHYQRAAKVRDEFRRQLQGVFGAVDMIVLPTQSLAGPSSARMQHLLADPGSVAQLARYTCAFDMAGSPLLVLPSGRTCDGVPISFQLIGPSLSEERLIAVGSAYQDSTSWHLHRPNL
jgi:amidase